VLLPVRFNDGTDVPEEWLGEAFNEIVDQFGAAEFETHAVEGQWRHEGSLYRDELSRVIVDIPDTAKNRKWMKAFKERWRDRLGQFQLWMVSYIIDVE